MCVCLYVCVSVFCHIFVDIKLEVLAKGRLCFLYSKFVSGAKEVHSGYLGSSLNPNS